MTTTFTPPPPPPEKFREHARAITLAIRRLAGVAAAMALAVVAENAAAQTPANPGLGIQSGSATVFVANPDDGFFVESWSADCVNSDSVGRRDDANPKRCVLAAPVPGGVSVFFAPVADPVRTVNIDAATNGTVVATVAGSAVLDGESAVATEPVTFTAIPASDGFYVTMWTGNCSAADTGENDEVGGTPKTCVVPAGRSPIRAGAVFAEFKSCEDGGKVATEQSGTCVLSSNKAEADNCESAGWGVTADGASCAIRVSIVSSSETYEVCFFTACKNWFASDDDGEVIFPQSTGPGDTRRFVTSCGTGKNPNLNDAGQTMCCDAPTTQDATTGQCQVTANSCQGYGGPNSEPDPTDNTKCVCKTGFTGEPPACRDSTLASGLLPAGVPVTTAALVPDDIPGTGNLQKCQTIGAVSFDNGLCRFANHAYIILNDNASGEGLNAWRNCSRQRRPVIEDEGPVCGDQCAAGEVVRDNACVPGTWDQCHEITRNLQTALFEPVYACDANATCSDSSESTTETAAELCTCNQGHTGEGTPGNCAPVGG